MKLPKRQLGPCAKADVCLDFKTCRCHFLTERQARPETETFRSGDPRAGPVGPPARAPAHGLGASMARWGRYWASPGLTLIVHHLASTPASRRLCPR